MASKVRIEFDEKAFRALLRSDEVKADLERRARRIAAAAGPGHVVDSDTGRNRARAEVVTGTFEAKRGEAVHHNLTRAIDAGR